MYRKPLRRALVLLGVLPIALGAAPPAHAAPLPACTREIEVAGAMTVSYGVGGRTNVCFDVDGLGGLVVSLNNEASQFEPPTVVRAPGTCAGAIVALSWPAEVSVAVTPDAVCVGLNGLTTTVTMPGLGYHPDPQVWRTGTGEWVDQAFCLDKFVAWHLDESRYDEWWECAYQPHRVL